MLTLFLLSTAPKEQCLFETPVQLGMELKTQAVTLCSQRRFACHNQPCLVAASLKKAVDSAAESCCPHALGHASWLT